MEMENDIEGKYPSIEGSVSIGIDGSDGRVKKGNPGKLNEINGSCGKGKMGRIIGKPKLKLKNGNPGKLGRLGNPKENENPKVGRVRIGKKGGKEKVNPPNAKLKSGNVGSPGKDGRLRLKDGGKGMSGKPGIGIFTL